ncbi:MAG: methyltransferase domain-containing protein, partial [Flavobacteriales bacterium]
MMNQQYDTQKLYDGQADQWKRTGPVLLSDYSARPFVINLCEPVQGARILDLGCGEGYVGRELLKRGAHEIRGIDISSAMIEKAEEEKRLQGITNATYEARDIRQLRDGEFQVDCVL